MKKEADWKSLLSKIAEQEGMDLPSVRDEKAEEKPQSLTISVEKRGPAKKKATLIIGYDGNEDEVVAFGSMLRKKLSTGGSTRGNEVLLQGDVGPQAAKVLEALGHKVTIRK